MSKLTRKQHIQDAAHAHTNLNIFAAVVSILEGGHLYSYQPEAAQIIKIAQKAQGRLLREYDKATASALRSATTDEVCP